MKKRMLAVAVTMPADIVKFYEDLNKFHYWSDLLITHRYIGLLDNPEYDAFIEKARVRHAQLLSKLSATLKIERPLNLYNR